MSAQNLKYGAYAGLAGGVVFGAMMGMMGMLPMIGQMVGSSSSLIGFLVHMVNSAIIGAAFAVACGGVVAGMGSGVGYGLGYGAVWWLLGPLTLMPLFMGMGFGINWNVAAIDAQPRGASDLRRDPRRPLRPAARCSGDLARSYGVQEASRRGRAGWSR